MNNVIKRRKTANYTQINNHPIQEDIKELGAIGLLTYIMSLPEDWELHKTQLHTRFTRRTVESAWKVLMSKNYAIGFSAYVSGKKGRSYFYMVSDIPFSKDDFNQFLNDVAEALDEEGKTLTNPEAIDDSNYDIPEEFFTVQNVQYKKNSTKCATTKEINTKEINTNKHLLSIVNLQETSVSLEEPSVKEEPNTVITDEEEFKDTFTDVCHSLYADFANGRWSKKQWNALINKFVAETIENERHKTIPVGNMLNYAYVAIKRMAKNKDTKKGTYNPLENVSPEKPKYDWLNN